jgi:hypothetical protein
MFQIASAIMMNLQLHTQHEYEVDQTMQTQMIHMCQCARAQNNTAAEITAERWLELRRRSIRCSIRCFRLSHHFLSFTMFAAKRLFASSRRFFSSSSHTLVIADHDNSKLLEPTLASVSAATKIGGKVTVLVAGSGCDAAAKQVCEEYKSL